MNTKKIVLYLIILLFSSTLQAQESSLGQDKSVLILFSGSHEFLVNRQVFNAFEKELRANNIKLVSEYLGDNDSVLFRDKEVFLDFFIQKYGKFKKFDLVIAFNTTAIDICKEYGPDIFPETKILNLDIFDEKAFPTPIAEQIKIIDELHQNLEYLLIISDNSCRGKILNNKVKTYIDSIGIMKEEAIYIDFHKLNYSEVKKYEYYSQKNSVILLLSAYQDASLNRKEYYEQIMFLKEELNLPIYSLYDKGEGEVIGGYYFDVDPLVEQLSVKVMLIINNMPIEQIDITDFNVYKLYFNQVVADKYNLNIQKYRNRAMIRANESEKNSWHRV